ncbi:hypothetical protein J4Q44_G00258440 [Coregonus suidteri]|uniref:Uncharacterized protein n=1 Tax=Coregonus suidteri TaxID=861788 RepID=A0AAN8L7A3_9TELE
MKSIFSLCTGFSFHWFSKASTLFEMLGTSTVLELKGISHHSNSGEVTESKALRRILLRFLKNMGSIGTDLTAFIEALCQSPRFSWPVYVIERPVSAVTELPESPVPRELLDFCSELPQSNSLLLSAAPGNF